MDLYKSPCKYTVITVYLRVCVCVCACAGGQAYSGTDHSMYKQMF